MHLRPYQPRDRERVVDLNNAAIPAVSHLDGAGLDALVGWATSVTVVESDVGSDLVIGFLICLSGPGLPYPSVNYQWLSERYDAFLYVDRVVVDPSAKGGGVGQALYHHVVETGARDHGVLLAEVNTRPRNDASLRFHERFGFVAVGRAETDGGAKEVVYLELSLALEGPS
ncbi:MAG: GNAT family N-acetyltransferase [Acidimicrobiales bacterium]